MAAYVYTSLNEVPQPWRYVRSVPLNLEQVNAIVSRAYELCAHDETKFAGGLAQSRKEFSEDNTVQDSVWVPIAKPKSKAKP